MNYKNKIIKFISFAMSIFFVLLSLPAKLEAKKLNDYNIHTSKSRCLGANFDYKKNDDGENTITLLNVNYARGDIKISSPVDSYEVTRVSADFCKSGKFKVWNPFFQTLSNNIKIFFKNVGETFASVTVLLMPIANIFAVCTPNILFKFEDFEPYRAECSAAILIKEVDLSECLEVGECAFCNCYFLKKVNLPKCEKIGNYAFSEVGLIDELCISKNVDLQSSYTRSLLQGILDSGGILKYIDDDGKEVRAYSLNEFTNYDGNK